jgi:DNA polymerase
VKTYYGLDYETFSKTNLPERGLDNYVNDESFRPLLASFSTPLGEFTYDFVYGMVRNTDEPDYESDVPDDFMRYMLAFEDNETIIAHNAPFERAVTDKVVPAFDWKKIEDSAVDARMLGAESKLEVASRQLTDNAKLEVGHDLVMLFCVPNDYYPEGPTPELIAQHGHEEKWATFIEYCEMDAKACVSIRLVAHEILDELHPGLIEREARFEQETYLMNQAGWAVDKKLVEQMKRRAWANSIIAQRAFMTENDQLVNFNSPKQLRAFCEQRGVKVSSLDKYHLPVVLNKVKERLAKYSEKDDGLELKKAYAMLKEVEALLETKLEIGGSTLSKLPVILNLMNVNDGILRDQYMHVGAGQTFRTTGRGVQMQNIKKLDGNIRDTETIYDLQCHWSNGDMAGQLRQVFTSRHPDGELITGDFAGVESRGLAYEAGEEWKLEVFRSGRDVYKELVVRFIPGLTYDQVTSELRPRGKYSELSCGYQASGQAVQDFMFRLGFEISLEDATQNVVDWRGACPAIVNYWAVLDDLLKDAVKSNMQLTAPLANGLSARVTPFALKSVQEQHPGSVSLALQILVDGKPFVTRFVHGAYFKGSRLCYYKAADRLSRGELWIPDYTHPKQKGPKGEPLKVLYSIYGGKLAGIFTQSLCREMFFESLVRLRELFVEHNVQNAFICGQFHDEINVDWVPGEHSLEFVKGLQEQAMTETRLKGFPLDAEVKTSYRYIK